MATQAQKFEAIKNATNAVGEANGVFKHFTKDEAILFIRDIRSLMNNTESGFKPIDSFNYSTVTLLRVIEDRDLADTN